MIIMQQQWLVTTNKNIILDMVHSFAFFKLSISETAFSSSGIRTGRFIYPVGATRNSWFNLWALQVLSKLLFF
jgi:hypothetical protein